MGEKSYLKDQVYLMGLNNTDLFTDEEKAKYMEIINAKNELNKWEETKEDQNERKRLVAVKKKAEADLDQLITSHVGPRVVKLENLIYHPKDSPYPFPKGLTWKNLKFSKKISEFSSELTRAMGLGNRDYTLDQIVVSWRSKPLLHQIITDGIWIDILNKDDSVSRKHYHFFTASAGQLRRDKLVLLSDEAWEKIHARIECGLTWEKINNTGQVNVNKYLAYLALAASATDEWTDFDIDRCIVIPDFEGSVTDRMMYIKAGFEHSEEICTVKINHIDGCGMMLPCVSGGNYINFMIRMPWVKGLLSSFDFLEFCRVNNVPPVIKDIYGTEHDLIRENIQILLTDSQFKMAKHYESWEAYKKAFKECGAKCGKTNYEEEDIENASGNYQFIQSLTDVTDTEIKALTQSAHTKILNVTKDKRSMLETLKAKEDSDNPFKAALWHYPEMLWEGYTRGQLKDTRKRMLLDAKSGRIRMRNKRLFAIPDLYAACQYYFQHIENPEGLLKKGDVACQVYYKKYDKADVLRSPHLYCEHAIRNITKDPEVYKWFRTNGIYTSTHDLISRILQFDRRSN